MKDLNDSRLFDEIIRDAVKHRTLHSVYYEAGYDAATKMDTPQRQSAIRGEAMRMLREYGLSDQQIAHEYNSNPLLRSRAGQLILRDAAQFRLNQRAAQNIKPAAVPPVRVQTPGPSGVKARQLGVSTYVAARLYHRTIGSPGLRTIILGHERRASSNLFQIVKRFHDNLSDELRPSVGTSNAEELIFDRIDSGYIVAVASGEGTGRSATAQLLHASETAFWEDLPLQMASLMQVVPDLPGTEILLESTANGFNDFQAAMA